MRPFADLLSLTKAAAADAQRARRESLAWRKVLRSGGAEAAWNSTNWGSAAQPGQLSWLGVPSAWKILPSWSRSVSPGNHALLSSSSAAQLCHRWECCT